MSQSYNAKKRKGREGFLLLGSLFPGKDSLTQKESGSNACCSFNAISTNLRNDRKAFILHKPLRSLRFFAPFAL